MEVRAPLVSVIIEGYNESKDLGSVDGAMAALLAQRVPLDLVEVILVGSAEQCRAWEGRYGAGTPFAGVRTLDAAGAHYYELKNRGADHARGAILAFTDSDAIPAPTWLSSIVKGIAGGAEAVAGLSVFRGEDGLDPDHPLLQAASSISWGFVVGPPLDGCKRRAKAFLAHNIGIRADAFRRHRFRTDLGRTSADWFLFRAITEGGAMVPLQPRQRVAHSFSPGWWVATRHFRSGFEVFRLRRLDERFAHRWVRGTLLLEPPLTMAWHLLLDIPQWFRYSAARGLAPGRRAALLPLVLALALVARGAELVGMYATLVAPEAMRRYAETS